MRNLVKNLFFAVCLCSPAAVQATLVKVEFSSTSTTLASFEGATGATSFYNYDNGHKWSANPLDPVTGLPVALTDNAVHLFSFLDTNNDLLSVGLIIDKPRDGSKGSLSTSAQWSAPGFVEFADESREFKGLTSTTSALFDFNFNKCCTDGLIIGGLNTQSFQTLFSDIVSTGLQTLVLLSPDGVHQSYRLPTNPFDLSVSNVPVLNRLSLQATQVSEPDFIFLMSFLVMMFLIWSKSGNIRFS